MKCLDDCHNYHLDMFVDPVKKASLRFYEMRADGTKIDGVTNEEVISVLVDRLRKLNSRFPCRQNSIAIRKLEEALMWLEDRTKNRESRGVEGQHKA